VLSLARHWNAIHASKAKRGAEDHRLCATWAEKDIL